MARRAQAFPLGVYLTLFLGSLALLLVSCKPMQTAPSKAAMAVPAPGAEGYVRSEERRVGKECRL